MFSTHFEPVLSSLFFTAIYLTTTIILSTQIGISIFTDPKLYDNVLK